MQGLICLGMTAFQAARLANIRMTRIINALPASTTVPSAHQAAVALNAILAISQLQTTPAPHLVASAISCLTPLVLPAMQPARPVQPLVLTVPVAPYPFIYTIIPASTHVLPLSSTLFSKTNAKVAVPSVSTAQPRLISALVAQFRRSCMDLTVFPAALNHMLR